MSTRAWPDKRMLFVRCEHRSQPCECNRVALAELHARWDADTADLAAVRAERERVELADHLPPVVVPPYRRPGPPPGDDDEPDPDLLAVACAWICLLACALIIGSALLRWAWLVIT